MLVMNYGSIISTVFMLGVIGFMGGLFWYMFVVLPARLRKNFLQFASTHSLAYTPIAQSLGYRGILPGNASNLVTGQDAQTHRQVQVFHYVHVVGSGKNRKEYDRTVLALNIKRTNTHIFVNSRVNDLPEQVDLAKSQRFAAEGDFGKYFDIYSPEGQQIQALSIFAPDAMSFVMAECGFYDIEIVGDTLYIYDYKLRRTQQELEEFYQLGNKLAVVLDDNAPRTLNMQGATGQPATSAVTALKKSTNPVAIALVLMFVLMNFGQRLFIKNAETAALITPLFSIGIIVLSLGFALRAARLKQNYLRDRQKFFDSNVKKTSGST